MNGVLFCANDIGIVISVIKTKSYFELALTEYATVSNSAITEESRFIRVRILDNA